MRFNFNDVRFLFSATIYNDNQNPLKLQKLYFYLYDDMPITRMTTWAHGRWKMKVYSLILNFGAQRGSNIFYISLAWC